MSIVSDPVVEVVRPGELESWRVGGCGEAVVFFVVVVVLDQNDGLGVSLALLVFLVGSWRKM